jgi:lipoyl-dependent peroxiredoxin
MEALYTAIAHATGGGRNGHVLSEDNTIDMDVRTPKEMGGSGEGTNPEQLFAAGYAACFLNAALGVARRMKLDATDAAVSASISIGKVSEFAFGLSGELTSTFRTSRPTSDSRLSTSRTPTARTRMRRAATWTSC